MKLISFAFSVPISIGGHIHVGALIPCHKQRTCLEGGSGRGRERGRKKENGEKCWCAMKSIFVDICRLLLTFTLVHFLVVVHN